MKNSFQLIQEANFSPFFLNNLHKNLNDFEKLIESIQKDFNELQNYIVNVINDSIIIDKMKTKTKEYIDWIDDIYDKNENKKTYKLKEKYKNNFENTFKKFIDLYQNQYLKNINESIQSIQKIYDDIMLSFDPPEKNNITDDLVNLEFSFNNKWEYLDDKDNKDYSLFYENNKLNSTNVSESNSYKCDYCNSGKISYVCNHCCSYYCMDCYNKIKDSQYYTDHSFVLMDEKKAQFENDKMLFLESFIYVIKEYIKRCNYIIKRVDQNYVNPTNFEAFQFPVITNKNELANQIVFLNEINDKYSKMKHDKNLDEEKINNKLFLLVQNMFEGKEIDYNNIYSIENDFIVSE